MNTVIAFHYATLQVTEVVCFVGDFSATINGSHVQSSMLVGLTFDDFAP